MSQTQLSDFTSLFINKTTGVQDPGLGQLPARSGAQDILRTLLPLRVWPQLVGPRARSFLPCASGACCPEGTPQGPGSGWGVLPKEAPGWVP